MDRILFELLPYAAVAVAIVECVRRYVKNRFTYSSLSSQFLEGENLFLGSVPWHYCIMLVLLGHLVAFLIPERVLAFNAVPVRLYILEVAGLACGLTALIGLIGLAVRRATSARVRAVTSPMDIVILAVLLLQVGLGVYIALTLRWGSSWFAVALVPYLRSLFAFQPDASLLSVLPLAVKLHVLGAFVLVGLLPFSRLVHALVVPWQYLWLRPQLVIWNRRPQ
ncbi:MAG: respiratory nitrate reductase subunit gamma [Armatimonadota bacterium]